MGGREGGWIDLTLGLRHDFEGVVASAHDISEGGLAVALAECCFDAGLGAKLKVDLTPRALFSETQARAILAVEPGRVETVLTEAETFGVPAYEVGEVGGDRLRVDCDGGKIDAGVEELRSVWATALGRALDM